MFLKIRFFIIFIGIFLINASTFAQNAGSFIKYQIKGTDLLIEGTNGTLLIQSYSADIFKVQFIKPNTSQLDSSYCVVAQPKLFSYQLTESNQTLEVSTEKCKLEINKFPLQVALKVGNQTKIKEDFGIKLAKDSVYFSFKINPNDAFHGSGVRVSDVNLKGKVFDFYQTFRSNYYEDTYASTTQLSQSFNVPFIVSSHQYGLFLDSNLPGAMRMFIGAKDSTKLDVEVFSKGKWAYYIINGNSNDEILNNYTYLTGKQPLPPRWAFGYIQSKFGYKTEAAARDAVSKLQTQGFPLDALVLDLYWYGDETQMGNLDWAATQWQNPTQMMKDFASKGVKTILINDPYITKNSKNFRLADSLSYLTFNAKTNQNGTFPMWNGTVGLLDIFKPKTQNWLWQNYKRLTNQGVGGWWSDKIEPEKHPEELQHPTGNAIQVHNLYPLIWAKNMYDGFRADFPNKRLFHLIRSGYAGSQRYGALPWTGDVMRYWSGMKLQIPMMINSGMTALAYTHSDIGGFYSDQGEKDDEMDTRWFQLGVFSPIMRSHGYRSNTEPYNLSQLFLDIVKNQIKYRYRLLPYLYTLAYQNSTTGRPICMPMDYFNLTNSNANITDQYFFGESLVVAPVLLYGMPQRKVQLPKGKWINYWTNKIYDSEAIIFEKLTDDNIPVYAKAGSLIPLSNSNKTSTDFYTSDSLTVKFFQDISVSSNTFTMFHDDGSDPNSIDKQRFELIDFTGKTWTDSVSVELNRKKNFDAGLATRHISLEIINFTSIPKSIKINNQTITLVADSKQFNKDNLAYYDITTKQLKIRFLWNCNTPTRLSVVRDGLSVLTANEEELVTENTLNVYPNPSFEASEITVESKINQNGSYELRMFDINGKLVLYHNLGNQTEGSTIKYPLKTKALKGIFFLKLENEKGNIIKKTVVLE